MVRYDSRVRHVLLLVFALTATPACLVLSVNPALERESLVFDPKLVGEWYSADDNVSISVEAGEWQSYTVEYAHPVEKGRLTAYLFSLGTARYLDVMPGRGEDHGSFLLPAHAVVRVQLENDRLELVGLSYDWFFDRLKKNTPIAGLNVVLDEKENALIVSPSAALRTWLRRQAAAAPTFGPSATFLRKKSAQRSATLVDPHSAVDVRR